jgi:predicted aspartyl protease
MWRTVRWRTVPFAALLLLAVGAVPVRADIDADYAIPTRIDRIGRIIVPVTVNCQGPFQFVLDTGANASVLSPHLAEALGLKVDLTRTVTIQGVTGSASAATAPIDQLAAGETMLEKRRLAVADASFMATDGVLGADGFSNKVVLVDFMHDYVHVLDARKHRPSPGLVRIPVKAQFGRLLMVDALIGTHRVKAVIDTGAQRTLGNLALYARLGLRPIESYHDTVAEVIGAMDYRQPGERYVVREIRLGDLRTTQLTVTFGDFHIFKVWNLESEPAMLIGMDMIGTLDTFGVDYLRREVQMKVIGPDSVPVRPKGVTSLAAHERPMRDSTTRTNPTCPGEY